MPRVAIFSEPSGHDKDKQNRLQAILTNAGMRAFDAARKRLGALYAEIMGRPSVVLSDADTIEYLARGDDGSRQYLQARKRWIDENE